MASTHITSAEYLLVTGVTGYIGFKTLKLALDKGYRVRGLVRRNENIADLVSKSSLIAKSHETDQLDFYVLPNLLDGPELVKALAGITAVVHLASPLAKESDDYEKDIVQPAIDMVTTMLEAATKTPTIKRLVITSSCVTLIPFEWNMSPDSERLYTAADINDDPKRPFSMAMEAYWASKALARIATRDFFQVPRSFDYVNLLPSVVIGPDERISADGARTAVLEGTRAAVMAPALTSALNSPFPYVGVPVHVHDVARAHVDAVDPSLIAGNTEFILSSDTPHGVVWDRDVAAVARKHFGAAVADGALPLGGSLTAIKWRLDGMTTEQAFKWKFTSFEETMRQLIAQYLALK